jgi:putative redox protein
MKVYARNARNFQVEITSGRHALLADESLGVGDDAGPDPYALLLSALGACKVMTLMMYAKRKGWTLTGVEVVLDTYKVHAKDCEDCESDPDARVDIIEVELKLNGDLSADQIQRLEEISERCPVHRTLTGEVKIRTKMGGIENE